ncbi:MAG: DNA polymerase III subunit gamma/tau [Synergistaceae bacterium]|nr:DNA polymerase III subunit gamma/tau [Synergistaceae bacterium]
MSVSLYRKYRPQDFASVVGQSAAVSILTNALAKNTAGHAYLFSGSRGCGKTSIARIFAKALNCLHPVGYEPCGKCSNCLAVTAGESLDVLEIDGASNNGVENIRNIRSNVNLAPFASKHKIYIIDEVHMLSQGAFNALLKTLEEPPEYVVFIMATTEPHKVPVTIRSRCQHIPFHSISAEDITARLEFVCRAEGVNYDTEALCEIARQADGALRDGLSLLEQVISAGTISLQNVELLLGAGSRTAFERVVRALRADPPQGFSALKDIFDGGASPVRVFEELFSLVRNMWLASRWKGVIDTLGLAKSELDFLHHEVPLWKTDNLHFLLGRTLNALTLARQGFRTDILLGSFMLSIAKAPVIAPVEISAPVHQEIPQVQEIPAVQEFTPPQNNTPQAFDYALTLELLNTAQNNIKPEIFCALLDAKAYLETKGLILDVQHKYSFSRLKVDQHSAALRLLFSKFGRVFLRHIGSEDSECPYPYQKGDTPFPDYLTDEASQTELPDDTADETSQTTLPDDTADEASRPAVGDDAADEASRPELLDDTADETLCSIDTLKYQLSVWAKADTLLINHSAVDNISEPQEGVLDD